MTWDSEFLATQWIPPFCTFIKYRSEQTTWGYRNFWTLDFDNGMTMEITYIYGLNCCSFRKRGNVFLVVSGFSDWFELGEEMLRMTQGTENENAMEQIAYKMMIGDMEKFFCYEMEVKP